MVVATPLVAIVAATIVWLAALCAVKVALLGTGEKAEAIHKSGISQVRPSEMANLVWFGREAGADGVTGSMVVGRGDVQRRETYVDSPSPTVSPTPRAGSTRKTPADYAKLIPTNFDATHPEGLPVYVPPSGGAMRAVGGAYTLPNLAPVIEQYSGTCYANAATAALRYWNMNHRSPPLPENVSVPSRLFGFWQYAQSMYPPFNGGSSLDYLYGLGNLGGPNEQLWPHVWAIWYAQIVPSPKCFALAIRNSFAGGMVLSSVNSAADACKAIDNGQAIVIYMMADAAFQAFNLTDCVIRMPPSSSCRSVNHAVLIVGYDAVDGGRFLVQNSWGTGWGAHGFCYMYQAYFTACVLPYAYVIDNDVKPYVPVRHSGTVTVTPGKTTAVQATNGAGSKLAGSVLQDVQSSACPYNDTHVQVKNDGYGTLGSVQLLFDVAPAGGYLLKLSAFVGPYASMTASLDGVERTFKGDAEDCVEERIAVREVQYVKLVFTR